MWVLDFEFYGIIQKRKTMSVTYFNTVGDVPHHRGVVHLALSTLAQVRYMHWMTTDYVVHKELGTLYEKLDDFLDRFVESFLGTHSSEPVNRLPSLHQPIAPNSYSQILLSIKSEFKDIRNQMDDSALENIIDEITGAIDQTLYLLRMQ
jgi:hypothetical protein